MKANLFCLIVCLIPEIVIGQGKQAFVLYNGKGVVVEYQHLVNDLKNADVVLFGELHDNPIAHWLEIEITKDLFAVKQQKITLGAEMFETDNQLILDEYLKDQISQQSFEAEARLWPNYKTDYKPLVEFAKSNNLRFIATNVPRRYAAIVASDGLDSLNLLSPQAKSYIAPLPIEYDPNLPGYKAMLSMGGMPGKRKSNIEYMPMAQAIKDATMAHSIARGFERGFTFIHFHGSYHSNNYEGIYWYLKRYLPETKIVTIATVIQKDVGMLEQDYLGIANYVIVVPEQMTRTY